jgi:hypothetical protein
MDYHRQVLASKIAQEKYVADAVAGATAAAAASAVFAHGNALRPASSCAHGQLRTSQYISPSDNIMSPCTAKLTALRNKQVGK